MRRTATLLAALAVAFAATAATVRTATENFVTNKIAAAVAAIPLPDYSTNNAALVETAHSAISSFAATGTVKKAKSANTASRADYATQSDTSTFAYNLYSLPDWTSWTVASILNAATNYTDRATNNVAVALRRETGEAITNTVTKGYVEALGISSEESDPVWQREKSGYATAGAVAAVSSKVETLETWAIGDETSLTVREAGTTNATLEIAYTNKTLYASANEHTNTLNAAKAYTDGKAVEIAAATDAALAGKANRAWGETTSGGAPSPEDTLVIEKKKVALTGGGNFSYLESSTGGYWVMSISLGSTWTLESLADAQNPDVPATATFRDADGNAVYTVTSTGSREVYAVSGEQYIKVATVDGNDVITLTYPVATSEHPTSQYIPALEMLKTGGDYAEATAANWPDYIQSTAWSGQSGQWVCTITMKGCPGRGFFRAKYTKEGTVYTNFTNPLGLSTVTIGNVTYTVTVETVNGKKLMVLTEN